MRLVQIRPRCAVELLAVCTDDGFCQVLEAMRDLYNEDPRLWEEVTAYFYEYIPFHGAKPEYSKPLRGNAWQFMFGRLPDIGFRILWFYAEEPKKIVCTKAFVKRQGVDLTGSAILETEECRTAYMQTSDHEIEIMEIEEFS